LLWRIEDCRAQRGRLQGLHQTALATAGIVGIHQATFTTRKLNHGPARLREPFPERSRWDLQDLGTSATVELKDFPKDVREPMRAIQRGEHSKSAASLYLFNEDGTLSIGSNVAGFQIAN
jgi:hypothetical protein